MLTPNAAALSEDILRNSLREILVSFFGVISLLLSNFVDLGNILDPA
jgi:hypothetical protein